MDLIGPCRNWYRKAIALRRNRLNVLLAVWRFSELSAHTDMFTVRLASSTKLSGQTRRISSSLLVSRLPF